MASYVIPGLLQTVAAMRRAEVSQMRALEAEQSSLRLHEEAAHQHDLHADLHPGTELEKRARARAAAARERAQAVRKRLLAHGVQPQV